MLGKMLIHGLVAAALIGSAAAVYAQAKDNGYLKPDAVQAQAAADKPQLKTGDKPAAANGYLAADSVRGHDGKHAKKEHHREGRHHDDDDDD